MKTLVISLKSPGDMLNDFKAAYRRAKIKAFKLPHYEISFDKKQDFNRFVRNLHILSQIRTLKPRSVYELAKRCDMDVSNLNKLITFFEEMGAIEIIEHSAEGRPIKTPIVNYDEIIFNLAA